MLKCCIILLVDWSALSSDDWLMMIIQPSKHGSKFSDVVYKVESSAVTAKKKKPARTECAESICYAER